MEEKFDQIRLLLENKPYSRHIVPQYYAVENNLESSQDEEVKFTWLPTQTLFLPSFSHFRPRTCTTSDNDILNAHTNKQNIVELRDNEAQILWNNVSSEFHSRLLNYNVT